MLAKRVGELPPGDDGSSSRSGTASARSSSATATSSSSRAATRSRSTATSPSWSSRSRRSCPSAACSTARSSSRATDGLDFEALQLRLHPAASRVKLLASEIPASIVFFDLLCEGDRDLCDAPFRERRAALESLLAERRRRRCTSRRRRATAPSPPTGSGASRAPGSTA